jgi:uncharacterized protein (DUF1778 family)
MFSMARPKKTDDRKSTYFRFRCTDEEKEIIEQAASIRSLDASSWGRSELVGLAKRMIAREQSPAKRG